MRAVTLRLLSLVGGVVYFVAGQSAAFAQLDFYDFDVSTTELPYVRMVEGSDEVVVRRYTVTKWGWRDLPDDVTLTVPDDVYIGANWVDGDSRDRDDKKFIIPRSVLNTLGGTEVTVVYSPGRRGNFSGSINHTSLGCTPKSVSINGRVDALEITSPEDVNPAVGSFFTYTIRSASFGLAALRYSTPALDLPPNFNFDRNTGTLSGYVYHDFVRPISLEVHGTPLPYFDGSEWVDDMPEMSTSIRLVVNAAGDPGRITSPREVSVAKEEKVSYTITTNLAGDFFYSVGHAAPGEGSEYYGLHCRDPRSPFVEGIPQWKEAGTYYVPITVWQRKLDLNNGGYTYFDVASAELQLTIRPAIQAKRLNHHTSLIRENPVAAADSPIELIEMKSSLDREVLASQPELGKGLVADGVAPVLLQLTRSEKQTSSEQRCSIDFAGTVGVRAEAIQSRLRILDSDGEWTPAGTSSTLVFPPGEKHTYAYVEGISSDELVGSADAVVKVTAREGDVVSDSTSFVVRRPPVVLVHGFNSSNDAWTPAFKDILDAARPDFVFPVEYGVRRYSSKKVDTFQNTYLPFEANAFLLHQALKGKMENPFIAPLKDWYYLRYDVVAHSQGGVLARMLCRAGSFSSSLSYVNSLYPRGRFHRVITIGAPHNGSVLSYYTSRLAFTDFASIPAALTATGVLQPKFNPFGQEIRDLNAQAVDARAKFHCIRTTIDLNNFVCLEHRAMGIGAERKSVLLPLGSDAVVDLESQGGGGGTKQTTMLLQIIAHSDNFFGVASAQTKNSNVGQCVLGLLDGPASNFGPFYNPTSLSQQRKTEIDRIVPRRTLFGRLISGWIPPQGFGARSLSSAATYNFEASPASGYDPVGDFTWSAEVYGPDGVDSDGVSLTVNPQDSSKVAVTVAPSVVGDVILHVSYTSASGDLVVSKPQRVASIPPGASITGLELLPRESVLRAGESLLPEVWATYSNGVRSQLYFAGDPSFILTSSDTGVISIADDGKLQAIGNGMGQVQVTHQGLNAQARVQVSPEAASKLLVVDASGGFVSRNPDKVLYEQGDVVTLTATPDEGYDFVGWEGDVSGPDNSLAVTMDANKDIAARFARPLTLSVSGSNGSVVVENPKPTYYENDFVTLHAVAEPGYTFAYWSGDAEAAGTVNPCVIKMDASKSVTAHFTQAPTPSQWNLVLGATNGAVYASPRKETYNDGEQVLISAEPRDGHVFTGWSGDASGAANPLNVLMDRDRNIAANFSPVQRTLKLYANNGTIVANPNKEFYDQGENVHLTAVPAAGYEFSEWSGNLQETTNPQVFVMSADRWVIAKFVPAFDAGAISSSGLTFTRGGSGGRWYIQDLHKPPSATSAACSGNNIASTASYIETALAGPGTLTYWRKVSSEEGCDFLRVYLDQNEVAAWSGEQDWEHFSIALPAGSHTIRWSYGKDGSVDVGLDAAFLAQVSYAPESSFNSWSVLPSLPSERRGPLHRNGPMNLQNLVAHAMGLNPLTATATDLPRITGMQSNTATFLFRRAKGLSGVALGVKGTTNLATGPWSAADLINTSTTDRGDYESVEVTVPRPAGGKYFLRLEATSP